MAAGSRTNRRLLEVPADLVAAFGHPVEAFVPPVGSPGSLAMEDTAPEAWSDSLADGIHGRGSRPVQVERMVGRQEEPHKFGRQVVAGIDWERPLRLMAR